VTVRVVVADDHPVYLSGVAAALSEPGDIEVVGLAPDGDAALDLTLRTEPDVVVMDLHMPGLDGVEATRRLTAEASRAAVLVLTMDGDDATVLAAMRAGARGYLVKGASGRRIVEAVRAVAAGEAVFGADVAGRVLGVLSADRLGARHGRPFPVLTDREHEVLDLIAAGSTNRQIAQRLVLSDKTVRNHVSNIFSKLDVTDRAHAIVRAREAGLGR
jgi:DNA-binding NarL/FixJ family response regulator